MAHKRMNRRTALKGFAGITIGMPFLEEMLIKKCSAEAKAPNPPIRAFNLFFGLGIPTPLQTEGYEGVLEPLKPLKDKLLILRNVDQVRADKKGMNGHFDGSAASFTSEGPAGEARSGGPSLDQVIRDTHYPNGLPTGMVPSLVAGTFFRRSRICRYVHSYKMDGTVAGVMQEKPRDVFDRVFGQLSSSDHGSREQRIKQSVLDSVVDQYKFYTSKNSPLGSVSKGRITEHLERIREYEKRAFTLKRGTDSPNLPPRSEVPHHGKADPDGQGIDITLTELRREWRIMADIYSLAIQMDRVRFGSLTFLAAGERIRLTGDYFYAGQKRFEFNDPQHLRASGDKGCSHEWWHRFKEDRDNQEMRAHIHMKMQELAYFMRQLDNKDSIESNGKSILENMLLTISTESGDGRHSNVKRELSGIFHAITGANGRFKTNEIVDLNAEGIDVYNTILDAYSTKHRLGPKERKHKQIDQIRA